MHCRHHLPRHNPPRKEIDHRHQVPAHAAHPQLGPVAPPHQIFLPYLVMWILPWGLPSLVRFDSTCRFQMLVDRRRRQVHAPLLQHPLNFAVSIHRLLFLHFLNQLSFLGRDLVPTLARAVWLRFAFLPSIITRPTDPQAVQHFGHLSPLGALRLDQFHDRLFLFRHQPPPNPQSKFISFFNSAIKSAWFSKASLSLRFSASSRFSSPDFIGRPFLNDARTPTCSCRFHLWYTESAN